MRKVFDSDGLEVTGEALYFEGWLVFVVVFVAVGLGAGEFFEKIGILNGRGDFVVPTGPFAEVDAAAAVGAEGEVLVGGEDDFAAGGAEECF